MCGLARGLSGGQDEGDQARRRLGHGWRVEEGGREGWWFGPCINGLLVLSLVLTDLESTRYSLFLPFYLPSNHKETKTTHHLFFPPSLLLTLTRWATRRWVQTSRR